MASAYVLTNPNVNKPGNINVALLTPNEPAVVPAILPKNNDNRTTVKFGNINNCFAICIWNIFKKLIIN